MIGWMGVEGPCMHRAAWLLGVLKAHCGCHVRREERPPQLASRGFGSLWPCHMGFPEVIGEPQKEFKQESDMI